MESPAVVPPVTVSSRVSRALIAKRLNVLAAVVHVMEARVKSLERLCEAGFGVADLGARRTAVMTADPIAKDQGASVHSVAAAHEALVTVKTQYGENELNSGVSDDPETHVCGEKGSNRDFPSGGQASASAKKLADAPNKLIAAALVPLDRRMPYSPGFSAASERREPILAATELRRRCEGSFAPRQHFWFAQSPSSASNTEGWPVHFDGEGSQATAGESTVDKQREADGVVSDDMTDLTATRTILALHNPPVSQHFRSPEASCDAADFVRSTRFVEL
eukprot:TRINITY_DN15250_c0_g1_i3.p1 TRINITY_DN15250_c0_g1~~TRINITY_DN15250_c0_g1_i3.p1  ORF type:complete len:285 (-),score=48.79 TRINITY_DN15250_c0_g1_i3:122-955(-)